VHALSVRAKLVLLYFLVTLAGLLIFGLMSFGALQYALLQGKKTHLQGREDRLISLLNENRAKGTPVPLSEQLRNYALVTHEGNLLHIHNIDAAFSFPLKEAAETGFCLLTTTARGRCSVL
jgi:two-component system heavy metal sensor histidine kinase CusS